MSLILEALRKSEAERRRAQAPDLFAEPQLALPRPHPTWPRWTKSALASVALIVLLVLIRVMWPQATPVASTQAPQAVTVPKQVPASTEPRKPATTQETVAAAALRQRIQQSPAPAPASAPPRTEPTTPAIPPAAAITPAFEQPRMPQEPVAAAAAQPAPAPVSVPPVYEAADDTTRLSDLGAEERKQLPTLKLSMHMWNDTPAQRFVILDGQRLGEGDRIGSAVVEQITRDGAILDWNGRRLRVSMR